MLYSAGNGLTCLLAYFLGGDCLSAVEWFRRYTASHGARRSDNGYRAAGFVALMSSAGEQSSEARRLAAALAPILERVGPRTYLAGHAVGYAGTAVWQANALELAEPYRRLALDMIAAGAGPSPIGPHELIVARMAALLGDLDQAGDYFARARRLLQADGRRHLLAIVDHDEALSLRCRGSAERERALALLSSARAVFEQLGMGEWARRAQERAREVEQKVEALGRANRPPTHPYPDHLTAREVEVLRLLADGRTSKEIADALTVSLSTVERHLSNIYHKIGARSRVDATTYALRHDLA